MLVALLGRRIQVDLSVCMRATFLQLDNTLHDFRFADGSCNGTLCKLCLQCNSIEISEATRDVKGLTLPKLPVRKRKTHGVDDKEAPADTSGDESDLADSDDVSVYNEGGGRSAAGTR